MKQESGMLPGLIAIRPEFSITEQPNDASCGPTCLHAIYRYYHDFVNLEQVISEVRTVPNGGTIAVYLGLHALERGYSVTIYTYNLQMFDPTWFRGEHSSLQSRLRLQMQRKSLKATRLLATKAYIDFIDRGGNILFADISPSLLRMHLAAGQPLLTGLSATYLHSMPRENPETGEDDDTAGQPVGHFVVLYGLDADYGKVLVADPYLHTAQKGSHYYSVSISRVIASILLGVLTLDANIMVIEPGKRSR